MVKKTVEEVFRQNTIELHAFSRIVDLMSRKSEKRDQKKLKNSAKFPILQFSCVATL